jgi:hypothetical protein
MMLFVGILMLYLSGAALLVRLHNGLSWKEMVSFSFVIGLGVNTFFMFLCDVIGFGFNQYVLFFATFALIVFSYDLLFDYYRSHKQYIRLPTLSLSEMNYPAIVLFFVIFVLFYIITTKNLYWPTSEHDAIGSFDKLGMVMALEGKLKISLFEWGLQGSGGIYPPFFHGGIAYMYLFGAESPKIITTLFFISMLLSFYAIAKMYVSSIVALFFTLLLEITPELYSHAALLLGNLPTTATVGLAALTLFVALDKNDMRYLWLSAIFTALALWCRNDTIGFAIAALGIVAFHFLKEKNWKVILIFSSISFSTFIIWTLYLKFKIDIVQGSRFVDDFGFNLNKFDIIITYIIAMLSWKQFGTLPPGTMLYGLGFLIPLILILLNFKSLKSDRPFILVYFLVSFLIYSLIFYLIDEQKQSSPITELMESSFKRGMFCFLPILLFYAATNPLSRKFSAWLENYRLN